MKSLKKSGSRGFTLLEMAISLVIIGLLVGAAISAYTIYYQRDQITRTKNNIDTVNDAIAAFVQENGFYPCPAAPTDASARSGVGVANADCSVNLASAPGTVNAATGLSWDNAGGKRVRTGVVPVSVVADFDGDGTPETRQLVPGDKAVDGWNNRLTYAVIEQMAVPGTTVLNDPGVITLEDRASNPIGQTKHVILSHGSDGIGAYSMAGTLRAPCNAIGSDDDENCNGDATFKSIGLAGTRSTTGDANNFDDFVMGDGIKEASECPPNQYIKRINWRSRAVDCASDEAATCTGGAVFVGINSGTGKAICTKPACAADEVLVGLSNTGNAGTPGTPICKKYVPGVCASTDEVQVGTDAATGHPVCKKITDTCNNAAGYIQAGTIWDSGANAFIPRCVKAIGDACTGNTVQIGINTNGTAQCKPISCPAGTYVSGLDAAGNLVCVADGKANTNCPAGQVVTGIVGGTVFCGTIPKDPTLGDPLYARYTLRYGMYDTATGTFPVGQWNEYNNALENGIYLQTPITSFGGDPVLQEHARNRWRAWCRVPDGSWVPPASAPYGLPDYSDAMPPTPVGQLPTIVDTMTQEYCGRYICKSETGIYPFMARIVDQCPEGAGVDCNWGHFFRSFACLNTAP